MALVEKALKLVLKALSLENRSGLSLKSAMHRARLQLSESNRQVMGLAHRLAFEVLKHKRMIDFVLSKFYGEDLESLPENTRNMARIMAYEFKINRNPSLKVDEFLKASRSILEVGDYAGCVSFLAWLRAVPMDEILPEPGSMEYLAVSTSSPDWLTDYAVKTFGFLNGLRFLRSLLKPPPTYFRVNTLKTSEDAVLRVLEGEGFKVKQVEGLRYVYVVEKSRRPLMSSETYRRGWIYVQDLSSCLAVELSQVKPGDTVVDVCAAPGAKTSHLAQLMENTGLIVSIELSKSRAKLWLREVSRMGVSNAHIVLADASKPQPLKLEADVVLIDPPCSGTGVLHRYPSLKWRITPKQVRKFSKLQLSMLLSYANLVKPGGHMVYSTCSITVEENEMVVESFLNLNPDFDVEPIVDGVGDHGLRGFKECRRLYPYKHMCNGFFIARLVKNNG